MVDLIVRRVIIAQHAPPFEGEEMGRYLRRTVLRHWEGPEDESVITVPGGPRDDFGSIRATVRLDATGENVHVDAIVVGKPPTIDVLARQVR